MNYAIHLYVPKAGRLTPKMVEWLYEHGNDFHQPELYWPVRKLKPRVLALLLLKLDPNLIPEQGEDGVIHMHYPMQELGIILNLHERGVILTFPYMGSMLAQIVLRIVYTYIRYLYDEAKFWSYDPQLNIISYADDFQSIDETAELMEALMPKLLNS